MKYIFLDFDGVLHGKESNMAPFQHSLKFCQTLLPYKKLFKIIISSSWREEFNLKQLCDFSQLHSLKSNIIGITPIEADFFEINGRYKEINSYCKKHNIKSDQWLAIDDVKSHFPDSCLQLLFINSSIGITHHNLQELIHWLLQ